MKISTRDGTALVEANEDEHGTWTIEARQCLVDFAKTANGEGFNADNVRLIVGDPVRPNAMGSGVPVGCTERDH